MVRARRGQLWALLSGSHEIAWRLWGRCPSPMRTAIIACRLAKSLQKHDPLYEGLAEKYEAHAVGLLDTYATSHTTWAQLVIVPGPS